jgi:hypothetical protein
MLVFLIAFVFFCLGLVTTIFFDLAGSCLKLSVVVNFVGISKIVWEFYLSVAVDLSGLCATEKT